MIVSRYITREVLNTLFVVTTILLLAFLTQQSVRYLNYAATGKIPTNLLIQLIGFEIPYLLALLLPLGIYLAVLLSYGRMYVDNEMSILQLCGFGNLRLMQLALTISIITASVVLLLMLYVNPIISAKRQQILQSDQATVHLIKTLIPGRFQVSANGGQVMYAEKLSRNHTRAEKIFFAQAKENKLDEPNGMWMLVRANEGYQIANRQGQFFVAKSGYQYEGTPGQNNYKIVKFEKYTLRIPDTKMRITHQESETLPTSKLWKNYTQTKQAAELQWRLSIALATFLLPLLAVPLSAVRPRRGRYLIIFPAILVYVFYIELLYVARRFLEQGLVSPTVGLWWVHGVLIIVIAMVLLVKVFYWRTK